MGIFSTVRGWFMNLFKSEAQNKFDVKVISSNQMEAAQATWSNIIHGIPYWADEDIRTINFAKYLCYYTSKKVCLELKITVSGSDRADYINDCLDQMVQKSIRDKVEDACGLGGIILKPNGSFDPYGAIDYLLPTDFIITSKNSNGDILGAIFIDKTETGDMFYTRLEYHHFDSTVDPDNGSAYVIENKCYKSKSADSLGNEVQLTEVQGWSQIQPIARIYNVTKPLFGYFKMPFNNVIDYRSPEGVSIFYNCIEELRNLDVAWCRKSDEIYDSQHITFIDEDAMRNPNASTSREPVKMPRFVRGLKAGLEPGKTVQEHTATILTDKRVPDINSILSMISTKTGFSQGQFVLDRKTGVVTATQIESDDNETVETITDIRNRLKAAIKDLIYALDKYCDINGITSGYVNGTDDTVPDEDIFYFKDLLATFEQDRTRAYQLMQAGVYSKVRYLVEYEGFSEKDAQKMLAEAESEKQSDSGLFGGTE